MRQGERWHQPCEVKTEGVITLKERRGLITHYEVEMEVFTARELGSKEKSVLTKGIRVTTQAPGWTESSLKSQGEKNHHPKTMGYGSPLKR